MLRTVSCSWQYRDNMSCMCRPHDAYAHIPKSCNIAARAERCLSIFFHGNELNGIPTKLPTCMSWNSLNGRGITMRMYVQFPQAYLYGILQVYSSPPGCVGEHKNNKTDRPNYYVRASATHSIIMKLASSKEAGFFFIVSVALKYCRRSFPRTFFEHALTWNLRPDAPFPYFAETFALAVLQRTNYLVELSQGASGDGFLAHPRNESSHVLRVVTLHIREKYYGK